MFGKSKRKMSGTERFVMDQGRKAGNLKAPMKNTSAPKKVPAVKQKPLSPGKAGPMKLV